MAGVDYNLRGVSVCLAMPCYKDIPADTVGSLTMTQARCMNLGIPLDILLCSGSSIIEAARCRAAHEFLKSDKNRIFWVDSDIVWSPDAFIRLLCLSTKVPVVMAAYPAKGDPLKFFVNNNHHKEVETDELGLLPDIGTGLGFACIAREVMERLAENAPKLIFPQSSEKIAHIFKCGRDGEHFQGEDIAFWADIRKLGYTVHLDPTIELGHHGSKIFTGVLANHLQKVGELSDGSSC